MHIQRSRKKISGIIVSTVVFLVAEKKEYECEGLAAKYAAPSSRPHYDGTYSLYIWNIIIILTLSSSSSSPSYDLRRWRIHTHTQLQ